MDSLHIFHHIFCHLIKALILINHNRADVYDTEYGFQCCYSFVKIVFFRAEYIHPALLLYDLKISLHLGKSDVHLLYKGILKQIPVFTLDGDFRVFNQ